MFRLWDKLAANQVYVIAEMSANHAGKLENALEIVRQAAEAGADCVKIQTYTADTMTIDCDNEYFRIKGGLWDGYKLYSLGEVPPSMPHWTKRFLKSSFSATPQTAAVSLPPRPGRCRCYPRKKFSGC